LQAVVRQSQRIHQTLRDLMQFARPPRPRRQPADLGALVGAVAAELAEFAAERRVRLRWDGGPAERNGAVHPLTPSPLPPLTVHADAAQVRNALTCLLRNAIEAAPADGWAAVRLEAPDAGRVDVVVEDSGPGLTAAQREHLFDPFYSGRQAGRGRGLGLPTAWRLARENGGDVRLVNPGPGPTRFVLTLPLAVAERPAQAGDPPHRAAG
jgi:signal transduction histidine kinase